MTIDVHREGGVKIHTARSMASTINTSHNESLWHRHLFNNTLTARDDTLAVSGNTLMSDDQHRLGSAITCMTR
jgi:hypothetical protein